MKSEPKAVLHQLRTRKLDPNSTAAREIVEEVAERVLRNLTPPKESEYFPQPHLTKTESSKG
jgi:hypothetical protein